MHPDWPKWKAIRAEFKQEFHRDHFPPIEDEPSGKVVEEPSEFFWEVYLLFGLIGLEFIFVHLPR